MKIILFSLLVYGIFVATHEGEFWPFSIYPMFSQAGNPWTRALILNVTDEPEEHIWQTVPLQHLSFDPVPVGKSGVDQIDFSNFITKTSNWTPERRDALVRMFDRDPFNADRWMVAKAEGMLVGRDSVVVRIVPFLLMSKEGVQTNPHLTHSDYVKSDEQSE